MILLSLCLLLCAETSIHGQLYWSSDSIHASHSVVSLANPTRFPTVAPSTGAIQTNPTRTPPKTTPPPTFVATLAPVSQAPSVAPTSQPSSAAPTVEPTESPTDTPSTSPGTVHHILKKFYELARNKPLVLSGSAVSIVFLAIVCYVMYNRRAAKTYEKLHRRTQSNTLFSPMHTTSSFGDDDATASYHRFKPSFSSVVSWGDSHTNLILDRMEDGGLAMQYVDSANHPVEHSSEQYSTLHHVKVVQDQERLHHRLKVEIPNVSFNENGVLRPEASMGTMESRVDNTPNTDDSVVGTSSFKRRERMALTSPRELQLKLFNVFATTITPQDIRESTVDGRVLQNEPTFQRVTHHARGVSMPNL